MIPYFWSCVNDVEYIEVWIDFLYMLHHLFVLYAPSPEPRQRLTASTYCTLQSYQYCTPYIGTQTYTVI